MRSLTSDTCGQWGGDKDHEHLFHLCHISRHIKKNDIVLELASTSGDFLLKVAAKYPEISFYGILNSVSSVKMASLRAYELGLVNIKFVSSLQQLEQIKFDFVFSTNHMQLNEYTKFQLPNAFYFSCFSDKEMKLVFLETDSARAKLWERKYIFHLPLGKLHYSAFWGFLKMKLIGSINLIEKKSQNDSFQQVFLDI